MSKQCWGLDDLFDVAAGAAVLGSGGGYQDALQIPGCLPRRAYWIPLLPCCDPSDMRAHCHTE